VTCGNAGGGPFVVGAPEAAGPRWVAVLVAVQAWGRPDRSSRTVAGIWQSHGVARIEVQQTSSGRRGRRFEAIGERDLYAQALVVASTLPGVSHGVLLVPEMTGPIGIPDFLAVVGGAARIAERLASGIPPVLGELESEIVTRLHPNRPRHFHALAAELRIDEAHLRRRIGPLVASGALSVTDRGLYRRHPALTPGGTLYAIETKLRDWRRAVRQSRGYRTWASNYVLVLGDLSTKATVAALEAVESDDAGLYVDGRWLRRPRPIPQSRQQRFHGFEFLAAALADYQPSAVMKAWRPAEHEPTH